MLTAYLWPEVSDALYRQLNVHVRGKHRYGELSIWVFIFFTSTVDNISSFSGTTAKCISPHVRQQPGAGRTCWLRTWRTSQNVALRSKLTRTIRAEDSRSNFHFSLPSNLVTSAILITCWFMRPFTCALFWLICVKVRSFPRLHSCIFMNTGNAVQACCC